MEMPNGDAVCVGKAANVEELPVPDWARRNFLTSPQVLSPLNVYASSRQMAEGYRKVAGKRIWPWQRKKVREGAYEMAQGRTTLYQPLGYGRSYG